MSYKSILVHLDTSESVHSRLELSLSLAQQFDAYLTGFFTVYRPEPGSFYVMAGNAEYLVEFEKRRHERRGALERLFRAELLRLKVAGEWRSCHCPTRRVNCRSRPRSAWTPPAYRARGRTSHQLRQRTRPRWASGGRRRKIPAG